MSYYDDPSRTEGGQFYSNPTANVYEQANAGVNWNDSPMTASFKVQNQRSAMGLDPYTGGPKMPDISTTYNGGGYSRSGSSGSSDPPGEGQILQILGSLFMWVVVGPAAIFAALGGLLYGARALEGPKLAEHGSSMEFSSYKLSPPSTYLTAKELATPIDPKALLARFHEPLPSKKVDPSRLHSKAIIVEAYRCQTQLGCRQEMAKLDAVAADNLPYVAAGFFVPLIAKGDERAARDMCILPLMSGSSYRDVLVASAVCSQAIHTNPKSWAARAVMTTLDGSWTMWLAKAYKFTD